MASRQELRALITIAGRIDPSLQSAMLRASGQSMRLAQNMNSSANSLSRVSTVAKGAFLGAIAARGLSMITSRVTEFAAEGVKLASDLTEVQNVVDVTFGDSAGQINAWSLKAKSAFGLSELSAKNYSSTIGSMLKSSGITGDGLIKMSQNLTGLAGDLASFRNLSQDEAFGKIQSGISGETEPLRQLGINMSVANLEAFAMAKGIKTSFASMDQASQTILRYNYLLEHTKDAQGDYGRTRASFANQMRDFTINTQTMAAQVATKVLPTLGNLLQYANKWMDTGGGIGRVSELAGQAFTLMGDGAQWAMNNSNWLIPVVEGLTFTYVDYRAALLAVKFAQEAQAIATAASNFVIAAQCGWIEYQTFVAAGGSRTMGILTAAQWLLNAAMDANPIGLVVAALAVLGLAIYGIVTHFKDICEWIEKAWNWLNKWNSTPAKGVEKGIFGGQTAMPGTPTNQVTSFGSPTNQVTSAYTPSGISHFALGGIATRASIFGEAGPEMAIPLEPTPRSIGLLQQTAGILGVGGSNGSGNVVKITYAPVIQGGSGTEIQSNLNTAFEQFKAWAEDYFEDRERVALG